MSAGIPTKYKKSKDQVVKAFGLNHTEYLNDARLLRSFLSISEKDLLNDVSKNQIAVFPMFYTIDEFYGHINYAFVIFLFTMLEKRSRKLCNFLKDSGPELSVNLGDLSGSFLKRLNVFLTRIAKVKFETKQYWIDLFALQKVRDCIVHTGGFVPESRDEKNLLCMIDADNTLSLSEDHFIVLKSEFCDQALNTALIFLDDFTDEVHRYIKRRIRRLNKAKKTK